MPRMRNDLQQRFRIAEPLFDTLKANPKVQVSLSACAVICLNIVFFAFRCEPCNMDFITRRGLVAHTKTAPHKRLAKYMQDEFDFIELAT